MKYLVHTNVDMCLLLSILTAVASFKASALKTDEVLQKTDEVLQLSYNYHK